MRDMNLSLLEVEKGQWQCATGLMLRSGDDIRREGCGQIDCDDGSLICLSGLSILRDSGYPGQASARAMLHAVCAFLQSEMPQNRRCLLLRNAGSA